MLAIGDANVHFTHCDAHIINLRILPAGSDDPNIQQLP